ncbi:MAG: hypothetical protein AAF821_24010 [Cyanobacteria bacterium P01_D01_bin.156]
MWGLRLPTSICTFELLRPVEKAIATPMSQLYRSAENHPQYEICVKGHLASHWSDWFEGFAIALKDNGETLLSGPVVDQAALYGVLIKVRDLGLPLISVMPVQPKDSNKGE